jgi:hypothetical protein
LVLNTNVPEYLPCLFTSLNWQVTILSMGTDAREAVRQGYGRVPHSGTDSVLSESCVIRTYLTLEPASDAGFLESVRVNLALEARGSIIRPSVSHCAVPMLL